MSMGDLTEKSLPALQRGLATRQFSARELTEAYLHAIQAKDPTLHAYLTVCADEARRAADEIDRKRAQGERLSPLAGIPFAAKDNLCTKGIRTTCASRMLADFIPPYDAHAIERLKGEGAILLGKTNLDEFGMGSATEYSAFCPTHHPGDVTRTPGGSSGGSACAVAAHTAAFALGSDTGGSIRQPAAHCGLVGMKPTYGRVSRYGLVAYAASLDSVGPLTRTVADNAAVLSLMAGHDPRDATSHPREACDFAADLHRGVKGLRIGLPQEWLTTLSPEVRGAIETAASHYETLGARIVPVTVPSLSLVLPTYYILSRGEAASHLGRFDGIQFGYRTASYADTEELICRSRTEALGPEVKRGLLLGTLVLSQGYYDTYYQRALHARTRIRQEFDRAFDACDVMLTPVTATTAPTPGSGSTVPPHRYAEGVYTAPANLTGRPALSLPCGTGENGLPIGCQLMGNPFDEVTLYRMAAALEEVIA